MYSNEEGRHPPVGGGEGGIYISHRRRGGRRRGGVSYVLVVALRGGDLVDGCKRGWAGVRGGEEEEEEEEEEGRCVLCSCRSVEGWRPDRGVFEKVGEKAGQRGVDVRVGGLEG